VLPFGTELLFDITWKPLLEKLSGLLQEGSFLHQLLIGKSINGEIDFSQSFGLLTSGLFIPLGVVLPYIFSFYLVLSVLEDTGYLPRLAVFLDNGMHWLGLHGYAIIPTLLGLGCNVPGVMATRILESKLQRFITATLISIAVPCAALQAMIIGLVGKRGIGPVVLIYSILFLTWILIGLGLRFTTKGFLPELLIEIPPYRVPSFPALCTKLWMRIWGFVREALPIVIGAIFIVNLLYYFEVFEQIAHNTAPVITWLWGLPEEAIVPLLIGILRKDVAIGMFGPLELTTHQLITGSVILAMFFPCIATFVVLFRELKFWDGLKAIGIMLFTVLLVGTAVNLLLP
jgi:ferrous iron transport protein B